MKFGQFFQKVACGSMMVALLACPVFTSCYDDSALNERLDKVENDVTQIKSDLAALQAAVEKKLTVVDYNQIDGGYELLMSDGSKITIYNGADGQDGKDGKDGAQGPQGEQGPQGPAGADGKDGQDGKDGADGKDGKDGDAFFQSIELTEDGAYLVITLVDGTVYELPMGSNFNILFTLSDSKVVAGETVEIPYTVTGAAESDYVVVRVLASSNCKAEVLAAKKAVAVTPELGDGYVDIYAINNTTGELKAKTISFKGDELFEVAATVFYVSPVGGDIEVPVTTSADYTLEISDAWLAYSETKAIREETVVLTAAQPNTASADNKATVTMTSKATGKVLASFEVVQKNYYPELIADEAGEQIEWAETFLLSRYEDITLETPSTKKGTFTFELTDNPAKGAYKVVNMFHSDLYFHNSQMVQGQGGTYYADVEGDVLTVYYKDAVLSYGFSKDIELAYDAVEKTFSVEKIKTYSYSYSRDAYIYEYTAGVKVDAPAGEGGSLEKFAGTWSESFNECMMSGMPMPQTNDNLTVTVDGDRLVFENMFAVNMWGVYSGSYYGTLSADGKTISLEQRTAHTCYPGLDAPIVLTVEGNTLSVSSAYWGYVTDYVAVNPNMDLGGDEEEPAAGWDGAKVYKAAGLMWSTMMGEMGEGATMTLSMDVDADGNEKVGYATFLATNNVNPTLNECVPYEYDTDSQVLTLKGVTVGTMSMTTEKMDIPFTVQDGDLSVLCLSQFTFQQGYVLSPSIATDPYASIIINLVDNVYLAAVAEEPEAPAAFATKVFAYASGANSDPWWTGTFTNFAANQDRNATTDGEYCC